MPVQLHAGGLVVRKKKVVMALRFSRNTHVGHVYAIPSSWSGKDNLHLLVRDELSTTTVGDVYATPPR